LRFSLEAALRSVASFVDTGCNDIVISATSRRNSNPLLLLCGKEDFTMETNMMTQGYGYYRQHFILYSVLLTLDLLILLLVWNEFSEPVKTSFVLLLSVVALLSVVLSFLIVKEVMLYLKFNRIRQKMERENSVDR
jgi:hypothetical protein